MDELVVICGYVQLYLLHACILKEGTGRSRWKGEDGVVVIYIFWRKGPAGASRYEGGEWHCVLLFKGRGRREPVGAKMGYEMGRVS